MSLGENEPSLLEKRVPLWSEVGFHSRLRPQPSSSAARGIKSVTNLGRPKRVSLTRNEGKMMNPFTHSRAATEPEWQSVMRYYWTCKEKGRVKT